MIVPMGERLAKIYCDTDKREYFATFGDNVRGFRVVPLDASVPVLASNGDDLGHPVDGSP